VTVDFAKIKHRIARQDLAAYSWCSDTSQSLIGHDRTVTGLSRRAIGPVRTSAQLAAHKGHDWCGDAIQVDDHIAE
jgi:hypothetical protein